MAIIVGQVQVSLTIDTFPLCPNALSRFRLLFFDRQAKQQSDGVVRLVLAGR